MGSDFFFNSQKFCIFFDNLLYRISRELIAIAIVRKTDKEILSSIRSQIQIPFEPMASILSQKH